MALAGPIPVEFSLVFPHGAYAAAGFEPVRDFDQSSAAHAVQAVDRSSGQPLWVVEVIDADPQARSRTLKVKVAGNQRPELPSAQAGSPFVPVEFVGMSVTPYVSQTGRLAYSLRAQGIRIPNRATGRVPREAVEAA
jgi:hypothetical protein